MTSVEEEEIPLLKRKDLNQSTSSTDKIDHIDQEGMISNKKLKTSEEDSNNNIESTKNEVLDNTNAHSNGNQTVLLFRNVKFRTRFLSDLLRTLYPAKYA